MHTGRIAFCWIIASRTLAQEGGVLVELCHEERGCTEDALEIAFDTDTSTYGGPVEVGVEFPIRVVFDAQSQGIQGYSWGVKHDSDSLSIIDAAVTTAGTIIDPENPDTAVRGESFLVTAVVEGGFIAAVILSFREPASLPLGRQTICHAAYRFTARPSCTVLRFVDRQLAYEGSPTVSINITQNGESKQPRVLRHGLIQTGVCHEICDDLADNDGDGLADCTDPDCHAESRCRREACDDAVDNDADGKTDCDDPDCAALPGCRESEDCHDGVDNDRDSLADCADPDCSAVPRCRPEVCDDAVDNDADGKTDCDDPDCAALPGCREPEDCHDGVDNDRDYLTDCGDPDCSAVPRCSPEVCDDGFDNNEDGLADCDDPDCKSRPPCGAPEDCDDGADNDGDGFVDAFDWDCVPAPPEEHIPREGFPGGPARQPFIRGDVDGNGRTNLADSVLLILIVVGSEELRFNCIEALDANADLGVNLADAIPILQWVFLRGPSLPAPFPACAGGRGACRDQNPSCPL